MGSAGAAFESQPVLRRPILRDHDADRLALARAFREQRVGDLDCFLAHWLREPKVLVAIRHCGES